MAMMVTVLKDFMKLPLMAYALVDAWHVQGTVLALKDVLDAMYMSVNLKTSLK